MDRVMLLHAVIAGLIEFAFHLVQIPDFVIGKSPHTLIEPSHYFTVSVMQGILALSPTLRRTSTRLFKPNISNFNSSVQRTLFHCSIVQYLCALAFWSLLILFCFLDNGLLTVFLPYRPASQSLLTVDIDIFSSRHGFSCAVMFGVVSLLSRKLVTLMKLSSTLVGFGLPTLFLVLFFFFKFPYVS